MLANIIAPVTRFGAKVCGKVVEHSPELLLGGGIIAMVAGAVVACERTTKADEVLSETREQLDRVHEATERSEELQYTESDRKKDLVLVYTKTAIGMAKLYAPAVALEVLGIIMVLGSYGIMRRRNIALSAAYAALDKGFQEYRKRVKAKYGEGEDFYFRTGLQPKAVDVVTTDENGNEVRETKEELVADEAGSKNGLYTRWFDEMNPMYTNDAFHNKSFLLSIQNECQRQLDTYGFVTLNDAASQLGFKGVPNGLFPDGQWRGWVKTGECGGSGKIDFGIFDGFRMTSRDFVNGSEKRCLLSFNIDPKPIHGYIRGGLLKKKEYSSW